MIISRLVGGLGNQMFQYAAGRALAAQHGVPLLVDTSAYAGYGLHQGFELDRVFSCEVTQAGEQERRHLLGWQASAAIRRFLVRPPLRMLRKKTLVVEPCFHYWPGIRQAPVDCYLHGYWQSEKYFADQAEQLRAQLTFRPPMTERNAALAREIAGCNAVSVHVRRGDYLGNPANHSIYHECTSAYYQAAVRYIAERVEALVFFVFSDDIAWCRRELHLGEACQFIDHNQDMDSYCDMQLMSLCKHHIIANSTFSWWGAWLNGHPEKIVVAPEAWFKVDRETKDLCPATWVRL